MNENTARLDTIVDKRCRAATQVGAEPSYGVGIHSTVEENAEEGCVAHRVEGLGKVHCHRHGSPRGTALVKSRGNLLDQGQKRSGGRVPRPETMLGICQVNVRSDKAEH